VQIQPVDGAQLRLQLVESHRRVPLSRNGVIPGVELETSLSLIDHLHNGIGVAQPLQGAVAGGPIEDDVAVLPVGRHWWINEAAVVLQPFHEPGDTLVVDVLVGHHQFDRDDLQVQRLARSARVDGGHDLARHLQRHVALLVIEHGRDVGRDEHARMAAQGDGRGRGAADDRRQR